MEQTNIKVEDLAQFEAKELLNLEQYEGQKVPIEKVSIIEVNSSYNESGDFVQGLQRKVKVLKVETIPITTIKTEEGEKPIRASELFNLQTHGDKIGYSNSTKSKLFKLMKKLKVTSPKELIGKNVIITLRQSNKNPDINFLSFVKE